MRRNLSTNPKFHARFWLETQESDNGCLLWTGSCNPAGYGKMWHDGRYEGAHRVAWILTHGPIPAGKFVCHNCPAGDNPSCVNPAHLWLGSHAENMRDKVAKGRQSRLRGEGNGAAILTEDPVREIKRRYAAGGVSQRALAAEFGVSEAAIWQIVHGHNWPDVT